MLLKFNTRSYQLISYQHQQHSAELVNPADNTMVPVTSIDYDAQGMITVINSRRERENSFERSGKRIRLEMGESRKSLVPNHQINQNSSDSLQTNNQDSALYDSLNRESGSHMNLLRAYLAMGEFDITADDLNAHNEDPDKIHEAIAYKEPIQSLIQHFESNQ